MALNTEPKYPNRRAYVLKLSSDAKPDALSGRLENLTTGSQREFASADELVDAIAGDLAGDHRRHDAQVIGVSRDEEAMTAPKNNLPAGWWPHKLDEVNREIAKLATLCEIRILDRGVVHRVLHNDASVCGRSNPLAFAKLHNLLMLHFAIREKTADAVGQAEAAEIERYVIERLKNAFPHLGTEWPPT